MINALTGTYSIEVFGKGDFDAVECRTESEAVEIFNRLISLEICSEIKVYDKNDNVIMEWTLDD